MVNFIVWLIVGGIIGWLASLIMHTDAHLGGPDVSGQLAWAEALRRQWSQARNGRAGRRCSVDLELGQRAFL